MTAFIKRHSSLLLIFLLACALLPMLGVAVFDWPSADDFSYGILTHRAVVESGGNFLKVLSAAGSQVTATYGGWQGTFSAIFLMSLQPAVFSARAYSLVPFLLLGTMIFATFYLLDAVLRCTLDLERKYVLYFGVPVLLLQIEFVPSLVEAFYWYNGAVYYTFFYSLMLLFLGTLVRLLSGRRNVKNTVLAVVLAAVLGGGNFVTALLSVLLGLAFFLYAAVSHKKNKWNFLLAESVLLVFFLISMVAPGNAARQKLLHRSAPLRAILDSLIQALQDIGGWTTLVVACTFLLLIPVMYGAAKKMRFQFRCPGLWILASFLLFAAQNAPTFYAESFNGPGRLRDIVFYSYVWFVFTSLFYAVGWVQKKHAGSVSRRKHVVKKPVSAPGIRTAQQVLCALILILLGVSVLQSVCSRKDSSAVCAADLHSGRAAAYSAQMKKRQTLLDNPDLSAVKVSEIQSKPTSIFFHDITNDPNFWRNADMAKFYGKKSIIITK